MALRDILARFRIDVDDSKLKRADKTLNRAKRSAQGLFASLGGLKNAFLGLGAGLGIIRLTQFTKATLEQVDALGKMSLAIGVNTDDLQVLGQFAVEAGTDLNAVQATIKTLARASSEASDGVAEYADTFKALGIEVDDAATGKLKPAIDLFFEVGGALGDMDNATKRLALSQEVFGKGAIKLLPGFKDGSKAAREQFKALQKIAVVYDKDLIDSTQAFNDRLSRSALVFKRFAAGALKFLLPVFDGLLDATDAVDKGLSSLSTSLGRVPFKRLATAAALVATKLIPIRAIFTAIISRAAAMVGSFGGLTGILARLGRVLLVASRFILRFLLPFLIIDDIIVLFQKGDSAIGRFIDSMFGLGTANAVIDSIRTGFNLVKDAIFGTAQESSRSIARMLFLWDQFWDDIATFGPQAIDDLGDVQKAILAMAAALAGALVVIKAVSLALGAWAIVMKGAGIAAVVFGGTMKVLAASALAPFLAGALAIGAAIGAMTLAWQQWTKLEKQLGGVGFGEVISGLSEGKSLFEVVDDRMNASARAKAVQEGRIAPPGQATAPPTPNQTPFGPPTLASSSTTSTRNVILNDNRSIEITANAAAGQPGVSGSELRRASGSVAGALATDRRATLAALGGT